MVTFLCLQLEMPLGECFGMGWEGGWSVTIETHLIPESTNGP